MADHGVCEAGFVKGVPEVYIQQKKKSVKEHDKKQKYTEARD